jgi:hypothetical protein
MGKKISGATRVELISAIGERYGLGSRAEKLHILDEFVAVTGYHRKHAIRVLNGRAAKRKKRRARKRLYDEAVREAVVVLWEASDRICGKRLKPLLPTLLGALEGHGHMQLDEVVRSQLLAASAATIDRMLSPTRASVGRRRPSVSAKPAIRRSVPIRTFADWKDPAPGYMEGDLVAHCGGSVAGSFVQTLTLTDIASGWTECVALVVREGALAVEALRRLQVTMPFPLRGLDTDNGGEFLNDTVLKYCTEQNIEFTRSRPYRKNDQAWVEQKNGSVVRRLVGYGRLEGISAAEVLSRLYSASRLFVNFFQPSFKLAEKTRVGARVTKRYHPPATPCARLMASDDIPDEMKDRLRSVLATLDPLRLLDEIRAAQHHLVGLMTGETPHVALRRDADLDGFLKSLATAWQEGEVRPTHRTAPKPRRDWRTRKDPFEAVDAQVRSWFEAEPERTAKELFKRLQAENPNVFPDGQMRTLQRRLRQWRRAAARQLVFTGNPLVPTVGMAGQIGPTG